MHRGLRSGPRMGELFQGQDGSLWRSVGPLEVGAALAGRDEEEVVQASVPCKWSQVEASGLPHHIIPTLFYFSSAKFSGYDLSPKKVFSKKKVKSLRSKSHVEVSIVAF